MNVNESIKGWKMMEVWVRGAGMKDDERMQGSMDGCLISTASLEDATLLKDKLAGRRHDRSP